MEEAVQSKESPERLKRQPLNRGLIARLTYSNKNCVLGAGQITTSRESQLGATRSSYSRAGSSCWGWLGTGHACACSLPHGLHPAEFCCWGTRSWSLALQNAVGADLSGQPWQGQCWELPSAPGAAAVPRDTAWLEVERCG